MSNLTEQAVTELLSQIPDPYGSENIVNLGWVQGIGIDQDRVAIDLKPGYPIDGIRQSLAETIQSALTADPRISEASINISWRVFPHQVQGELKPMSEIKNIIAVASGKGGVGKSTTAVNLALALSAEGATVGILDADIYGPSQPRMLGVHGKPESLDGKTLEPMNSYHLQAMSIGFLVDEETPMIWRGPMVTQALQQLLNDTNWKDLDYLVVDLPPGTGDIQLTLAQQVPVSGAVIVTTPQDIALLDARKGLKMFEKVEVPVLGVVENMSTHICSQCGHEEHIFGEGGGLRMSEQNDVDFLGALPLDIRIREETDSGKPTVVAEPDSRIAQIYREIARRTAAKLSLKTKDYAARFPQIVISND